jgi:hypothetical protein
MAEIISGQIYLFTAVLCAGSADNMNELILRDTAIGLRIVGDLIGGGKRNVLEHLG